VNNSWQDQEDVERRVERTAFYAITDSIRDTQSAIKVLSITVTAELGALAMIYVNRDEVYNFLEAGDEVWIYAGAGIFVVGFLTAFAAFRLLPRSFPKPFFGYTIWVVSIAAGALNLGLFEALINFRLW
jgi:hypothetical protein